MKISLKGKNSVVCGSTEGIGKAIALAFARAGSNVTLLARSEDKLEEVLEELPKEGEQVHGFVEADFSYPGRVEEAAKEITDQKDYQILVNNTGGPPGGSISGADTNEFRKAFEMHLICNHILFQTLYPGMKNSQYGRIINIISTSVKQPIKGLGVSNTVRAAVGSWAKTLSFEVADFGITVNNILPGATKTKRLEEIVSNKMEKSGKSKEETEEIMKSAIPAARFGDPEELGNLALFLASPQAGYINGTNIAVDGGRTVCL